MARAYQHSRPADTDREGPAEWQSLRSELVALLDQVDGQVARSRESALSERMRDLTHQAIEAEQGEAGRHRDALRSVQRQITRFEEPAPAPARQNPRDSLQAAISQIRAGHAAPRPQQTAPAAPARGAEAATLERIGQSIAGISGRLERIEGEIGAQVKSGANVKDVADQVAQLAHVVELLAGAVGETGQVKRLEGQIASLGRIISQGREMDQSAFARRLDDVASSVGRLAELQVHFNERVQNPLELDAFKDGMRSIEESVRNVYDRIDSLERQKALRPDDLDVITGEMARFTAALQEQDQPGNLVALVDALNARISDIESGDRMLHTLRKDLAALRDSVVVSLTPRFDAIEEQLSALSAEVGTRADMTEIGRQIGALGDRMVDPTPSIAQVEAQVRQLVARMDQTGEQLAGLSRLYSEPSAPAPEIDFDAMAEMVAARAAEAMSRHMPDTSFADTIRGLETRIAAMLESRRQDSDAAGGDFGGMQSSIDEVNDRLRRLETSLLERFPQPVQRQPDTVPVAQIAAILAEAEEHVEQPAMASRDVMPRSPAEDAPLSAPPFPEPEPTVETPVLARRHHPGLDADISLAARHDPPPAPVTATSFEPPPAPTPSAGFGRGERRGSVDTPVEADKAPLAAGVPKASTNTFIEAARRMSQRKATEAAPAAASGSLIGRALSRFQTHDADAAPTEHVAAAAPAPEKEKPVRGKRKLAGDKPARTAFASEPAPAVAASLEPQLRDEAPRAAPAGEPGFLARNRRTLLLAALVVAVGLLTVNLVLQRTASAPEPAPAAPITTGDIGTSGSALPLAAEPVGTASTATVAPRVIEMGDPMTTASIDRSAAQGFATTPLQVMPSAFGAATDLASADPGGIAPLVPSSPVSFDLPDEGIGPLELRQAAANGDARAQFEVAAILTEGRAVPQDYAGAAIWYERAAATGFAPAQYRLGSLYENGNGVEVDLEAAKLWYERAAEAGNRMAMHNLAALYASGQLGKQEFDAAAKWFEEAASRGMTDSQFNLGMLYARGLGVPQSLEDSFKWFGIAARSGDADAGKARDDMARSLDAETMTRLTDIVNNFRPAPIAVTANFAPIGTWMKDFDPGETIAARDIVATVQRALDRLGYDVGTPDGIAGAKTQTAIMQFEQATGMTGSGQVNPRLLAVLGSQPV